MEVELNALLARAQGHKLDIPGTCPFKMTYLG